MTRKQALRINTMKFLSETDSNFYEIVCEVCEVAYSKYIHCEWRLLVDVSCAIVVKVTKLRQQKINIR